MIRIGVTGHSNLCAESTQLVFSGLRAALEPHAGDGLRGVTCLAAGADQLFARAILSLDGQYDVILPAPGSGAMTRPSRSWRQPRHSPSTRAGPVRKTRAPQLPQAPRGRSSSCWQGTSCTA